MTLFCSFALAVCPGHISAVFGSAATLPSAGIPIVHLLVVDPFASQHHLC